MSLMFNFVVVFQGLIKFQSQLIFMVSMEYASLILNNYIFFNLIVFYDLNLSMV